LQTKSKHDIMIFARLMNGTLRRLRERQALSQRDLAAKAGVNVTTINHIEQGKQRPNPSTIRKLAGALGVTPEELISEQLGLF